ncbi:MAG: BON domain-containing protein [Burkholderiaceae bacterium]|jgi:osmotically-inducible protein OsmY|nr:BON domain-containing protein [Burkholderiaceae bacterium]
MKLAIPVLAAALAASAALSACAPLVVGAIVGGTALVATDRRTTGAQVDDTTMHLRVSNELSAALKGLDVHISVNSFERKILLTGEVPNEQVKAQAGEVAARSANVRAVVNELTVAPPSSFGQRTNDTGLGAKVRAAFVNTKQIAFNSVDIVTERGVVYLLGFVTEKEGEVAAHVASRVAGVRQVVKVFDYGSAEEVQRRRDSAGLPPPATPAPTTPATTTAPATTAPGAAPR